MDRNLLLLLIYIAMALIAAAVIFVLRDLFGRRRTGEDQVAEGASGPVDFATLLPSPEMVGAEAGRNRSWLGQLATETGTDFTAELALLFAIMVALALGGAVFVWRNDLLAAVVAALLGVFVVGGLLFYLRARRYRIIRDQLPDIMELMARAVRAGESLDQAIALAGSSALRPVAAEFQYCANQMKMGLSLESAIRRLVVRMPLTETRILAMTLIVQRRRGGSLPGTLEDLARVFRDRSSFIRQFRAATALGRGSAAVIALVAIGLDALVVFGHSQYTASLLETNIGRAILIVSLGLQGLGILWGLWLFKMNY